MISLCFLFVITNDEYKIARIFFGFMDDEPNSYDVTVVITNMGRRTESRINHLDLENFYQESCGYKENRNRCYT